MKYQQSQQALSSFLEMCEKENLPLPENPYKAMNEANNALKAAKGKEKEALEHLKSRFSKRSQHESSSGESGDMPHHKRVKLAEEVQEKPAKCPENQKIVDAFVEYGLSQLDQGHTGKGSTHLRAAREIRDYTKVIKTGNDARQIGFVGEKMANQVEQVLNDGMIKDEHPDQNVSKDYDENEPQIVHDIRDTPAKCRANQKIVDLLTDYAENQLKYGNTGKGTSHLRAAKEIHNYDQKITSGYHAASSIGYIGEVIADKIDQILTHGKIVRDHETNQGDGPRRVRGDPAPIVQDLMDNPAKQKENQRIVDMLRDYGDAHLSSGHRGKGISHLRAAKEIRNSDIVIKSASDAQKIGYVGKNVARKVDQILQHGHADSDDDYIEGEEEEEEEEVEEEEETNEYGQSHDGSGETPLVREVRGHPAARKENQKIVDALVEYGQKHLQEKDTGRGVTYLRAARQLRDSTEVIKSGHEARKVGMIGPKVSGFIDEILKK